MHLPTVVTPTCLRPGRACPTIAHTHIHTTCLTHTHTLCSPQLAGGWTPHHTLSQTKTHQQHQHSTHPPYCSWLAVARCKKPPHMPTHDMQREGCLKCNWLAAQGSQVSKLTVGCSEMANAQFSARVGAHQPKCCAKGKAQCPSVNTRFPQDAVNNCCMSVQQTTF